MTLIMTAELPDPATQRTLAGRGARLVAFLVDGILAALGQFFPPLVGGLWFLLLAVINLWGILMHGQSIGKFLLKIAIVDPDTNLVPRYMRAAVIRSGPLVILSMLFPAAAVVYLVVDGLFIFSKTRRCLHDRFARTLVIVGTREWW